MITPLHKYTALSSAMDIELLIKRDDLYPLTGGGSKARKLDTIFADALKKGYDAVVTTGSNQSNHLRSTALFAARFGWKSIMVIHDKEPSHYQGNLKITALTGAEIRFVDKTEVKDSMDKAMADLRELGYNPLYIWGGGHSVQGAYSYYKAVEELKVQLGPIQPDFIVLPSGTGTTQAGIEIGIRQLYNDCQVLGVSVARNTERGRQAVYESMNELRQYLNLPLTYTEEDVFFDDSMMGAGYEDVFPELERVIKWAAQSGLILDPTYTAKAFLGLKSYIISGRIKKGSTVVFWHTGGLLNLMSSQI